MADSGDVLEIRTAPAQVVETLSSHTVIVDIGSAGEFGIRSAPTGYQHTQSTAATVWTVEHQLGFDPAGLTVVSSDGFQLDDFGVQYLSAGQSLRLTFDIAVSGVAYLS